MMQKPLVSVVMITYGHELYIRKAIEGVLMQKTDFNFELIVANDNSPDKSDEIIQKIIASVPSHIVIKYFKNPENLGAIRNLQKAFKEVTAEFVAFCEGDDYWTDPDKLQLQYEKLSSETNCGLVYTDVDFYDFKTGKKTESIFGKEGKIRTSSFEEHLEKKGYLAPPTWMFRKILLDHVGNEDVSDFTFCLALEAFRNSEVHYIDKVTAVRNFVPNSATSQGNPAKALAYKNGVFEIQKKFINKYGVSPEIAHRIFFDNYVELLPLILKNNDTKLLQEAEAFFESKNLPFRAVLKLAADNLQLEKLVDNKVNKAYLKLRKYF